MASGEGGIAPSLAQLRLLKTQNEWEEVKMISHFVTQKWPASFKGLNYLTEALLQKKELAAAVELLKNKELIFKNFLPFRKLYATVLIEAAKFEEAKEQLLLIHQIEPTSLAPIYGFARISRATEKQKDEAWTGERYVPGIGMGTTIMAEHFNRYFICLLYTSDLPTILLV